MCVSYCVVDPFPTHQVKGRKRKVKSTWLEKRMKKKRVRASLGEEEAEESVPPSKKTKQGESPFTKLESLLKEKHSLVAGKGEKTKRIHVS